MRDEQTVKIELLGQWKLEAEFRNIHHPEIYLENLSPGEIITKWNDLFLTWDPKRWTSPSSLYLILHHFSPHLNIFPLVGCFLLFCQCKGTCFTCHHFTSLVPHMGPFKTDVCQFYITITSYSNPICSLKHSLVLFKKKLLSK